MSLWPPVQAPLDEASAAIDEATALDDDVDALWVQVQQALSTKRELQRKLAGAENMAKLWEAHRESVQQLAASQRGNGSRRPFPLRPLLASLATSHAFLISHHTLRVCRVRRAGAATALEATQHLTGTLRRGWQLLESERANGAGTDTTTGPRGLQQRFSQRRTQISTVGVADLGVLSSLLSAN